LSSSFSLTLSEIEGSLGREMSSGNYSTHVNINNEAKVGDSLSVGESGEVVGEAGSDVEGKDRGHVKNDFADEGD